MSALLQIGDASAALSRSDARPAETRQLSAVLRSVEESVALIRSGGSLDTLDEYRDRLLAAQPDENTREYVAAVFHRIANTDPARQQIHQQINAHLNAADRNPHKRGQHLIAATQLAEANGIAHFGRWSEQSVVRRDAMFAERKRDEAIKHRSPTPSN